MITDGRFESSSNQQITNGTPDSSQHREEKPRNVAATAADTEVDGTPDSSQHREDGGVWSDVGPDHNSLPPQGVSVK